MGENKRRGFGGSVTFRRTNKGARWEKRGWVRMEFVFFLYFFRLPFASSWRLIACRICRWNWKPWARSISCPFCRISPSLLLLLLFAHNKQKKEFLYIPTPLHLLSHWQLSWKPEPKPQQLWLLPRPLPSTIPPPIFLALVEIEGAYRAI